MRKTIAELNVLVADDSATQRLHATQLCHDLGISNVVSAVDGRDALRKMLNANIDVAIVDLEMPIMDGIETLRSIAQEKCAGSIIILSAKDPILIASVGSMAEADGLKVLGTFQKPLQKDLLECGLLRFVQDMQVGHAEGKKPEPEHDVTVIDFCKALDEGQINLAYQPKLSSSGILIGVEALARWNHPTKGAIPPITFIPLAERHGLIDSLTRELIQMSFRQKHQWNQYGFRFNLAFNLSPLSLADPELSDWLLEIALQNGLAPEDITFEVTENALLGELACAIRTLARLRLKGFKIAIDDYGTGFANAQQLSRVPATELKVDRSLVHQVATRPQQQTILKSTIDLAKSLKLSVVAEGVENEEDFFVLRSLGVDLIQGYYFSKPLFPENLLHWIKKELPSIRQKLSNVIK